MKAVAYLRVSTTSQVEGYSLDAQERMFYETCKPPDPIHLGILLSNFFSPYLRHPICSVRTEHFVGNLWKAIWDFVVAPRNNGVLGRQRFKTADYPSAARENNSLHTRQTSRFEYVEGSDDIGAYELQRVLLSPGCQLHYDILAFKGWSWLQGQPHLPGSTLPH